MPLFAGLAASAGIARRLAGTTTEALDDAAAEAPEMDEMEISMIALIYLVMIGSSLVLGYFTFHRWNFNWFPEAGAPIAVRGLGEQRPRFLPNEVFVAGSLVVRCCRSACSSGSC